MMYADGARLLQYNLLFSFRRPVQPKYDVIMANPGKTVYRIKQEK
jgi:hypothetical protein